MEVVAVDGLTSEERHVAIPDTCRDVRALQERLAGVFGYGGASDVVMSVAGVQIPLDAAVADVHIEDGCQVRVDPDSSIFVSRLRSGELALRDVPDWARSCPRCVVAAVNHSWLQITAASPCMRADYDVMHAAVERCPDALGHASTDLRSDRRLVELAVQQASGALRDVSEDLHNDKDFMLSMATASADCWAYAGSRIRNDAEVAADLVARNTCVLPYLSDSLRSNKAVVMAAVRKQGEALKSASAEMQADKDVVVAAVQQTAQALPYAAQALQDDEDVGVAAIRSSAELQGLSYALRSSRRVVLAALQHYAPLRAAAPPLRDDKDIVLAALQHGGVHLLADASERLRNDKEVALAAVGLAPSALAHVGWQMQNDADVASLALQTGPAHGTPLATIWPHVGEVLRNDKGFVAGFFSPPCFHLYGPNVRGDKALAMQAVRECPSAYSHATSDLKHDKELALLAVSMDTSTYQHASCDLRGHDNLVLAALAGSGGLPGRDYSRLTGNDPLMRQVCRVNPRLLCLAGPAVRADRATVLAAVRSDGSALRYASEALRSDAEVIAAATQQTMSHFLHATLAARGDPHTVVAAVRAAPPIDGQALFEVLPSALQQDANVMLAVLQKTRTVVPLFLHGVLRHDEDMLREANAAVITGRIGPRAVSVAVARWGAARLACQLPVDGVGCVPRLPTNHVSNTLA